MRASDVTLKQYPYEMSSDGEARAHSVFTKRRRCYGNGARFLCLSIREFYEDAGHVVYVIKVRGQRVCNDTAQQSE